MWPTSSARTRPKWPGTQQPALPPGYDYDFINADVIEHRLARRRWPVDAAERHELPAARAAAQRHDASGAVEEAREPGCRGRCGAWNCRRGDRRVCRTIRPATPRCNDWPRPCGARRRSWRIRTFRRPSTGSTRRRTSSAPTASSGNIAVTATPTFTSWQTRTLRPVRRRYRFG